MNPSSTTQEILQSSHSGNESVERVLDPSTPQALRSWAQQIVERSRSELSQSSEDSFNVGAFTCMVEDAANLIERLHKSYAQGGTYQPSSS